MNAPDDCPIRSDDDLVLIGCRPTNHLFLHPKPRDRPRERGVFLPSTQLLRRRCRGARTGDDLQICCSCQRNFYPIERLQKPLTPADWDRVKEAQAAASFWSADPDGEFRPMFDGSHWTIRGCQGGRSHWIKRRSPYRPIRDLGELFIELAGSEAINEYF